MSSGRPFRVAIVGGGPAGAALATSSRRAVPTSSSSPTRSAARSVVGESLVPAIVPSLRRLGVEDAVAAVSQLKPGRRVRVGGMRVAFTLRALPAGWCRTPTTSRAREFEEVLAGARRRGRRAARARRAQPRPRPSSGGREVVLDGRRVRRPAGAVEHPDLLVDATGRAARSTRLLAIPARRGPRDDVAHFAHFVGTCMGRAPGHVLIGRVCRRMELAHPAARPAVRRRGSRSHASPRASGTTPARPTRGGDRRRRRSSPPRCGRAPSERRRDATPTTSWSRRAASGAVGPRSVTPSASSIRCCRPEYR